MIAFVQLEDKRSQVNTFESSFERYYKRSFLREIII